MSYPRTFAEFFDQHPDFVRMLIHKNRWAKHEDVEELEQELLCEMLRKQVVEKFDPTVYGDKVNIKLFMQYVITCVERLFYSTRTQAKAHVRSINTVALSLSTPLQGDEGTITISGILHDDERAMRQLEATTELVQLTEHIHTHHPSLIDLFAVMTQLETSNSRELAEVMGMSKQAVWQTLQRLRRVIAKFRKAKTQK